MRNLLAGQNLRQLLCTAGWVFGRDDAQLNVMRTRQHRTQHGDSLRFVIFNTDQYLTGLQNMHQDAHAFDYLCGAILHQAIISGDIGFAFGGIDNQCLNKIAATFQFRAGRETGAAQSGNAKLVNTLNQRVAIARTVIAPAVAFNPAILTVRLNNDAQFRQRRGVRGRVGGYGDNFT